VERLSGEAVMLFLIGIKQAPTQQLLRDGIDIFPASLRAQSNADDVHDNPRFFQTINNAIALASGSDAPVPHQLVYERFALLVRLLPQSFEAFPQGLLDALIFNLR